jgi:hypothetical protein
VKTLQAPNFRLLLEKNYLIRNQKERKERKGKGNNN